MARKPSKAVVERPVPTVLIKRDMTNIWYVVVEDSFHAVRALYMPLVMPGVTYGVYDCTILLDFLPEGRSPRYAATDRPLQSVLVDLRAALLAHGGTPEAVRLMDSLGLLTEEDIDMAKAKLATKGEAPAEKAPAAKKGGGNPEALKKAREARAEAGPDVRKVKILNKENPYRAESGRATAFAAILGAKTVEDYEKAGGKRKYLSRWVEEGRISLT